MDRVWFVARCLVLAGITIFSLAPRAVSAGDPVWDYFFSIYSGTSLENDLEEEGTAMQAGMGMRGAYLLGGAAGVRRPIEGRGTWRVELDGTYQPFKNGAERADLYSAMVNAWYEFETKGRVRPYLGGGVGIGMADDAGFNGDLGFAYQIGGGVEADLLDDGSFYLGAGYRYFGLQTQASGGDASINGHRILVYLGFRF